MEMEVKRIKVEPKANKVVASGSHRKEKIRMKKKKARNGSSGNSNGKGHTNSQTALIADNGAHTIKIGYSIDQSAKIIPNAIMKVKSERKRLFIGDQIEECRDASGLYYLLPYERGYITKWEVQKPIWDYVFSRNKYPIEDHPIVLTQPQMNFKSIQEAIDEIFFEEYECKAMYRPTATDLARYEYVKNVVGRSVPCVIVDSGYSFTHIVPYINGKKYYNGVKRINVGGKLLTNHLKDIISYRQLHVMDETYVINQVKEDASFVSMNVKEDLKIAALSNDKNTIVKNYVLPDFNVIRRGYIQNPTANETVAEGCQILRLNNDRFMVPEILFNPSDIGMESMGISQAILRSISCCPKECQRPLAENIVLIGGNANFPGFRERVFADIRSFIDDSWEVKVYKPDNPSEFAWLGGKNLCIDGVLNSLAITKQEYEENGSSYTYERSSDWLEPKTAKPESPRQEVEERSNYLANFQDPRVFGKFAAEPDQTLDVTEPSFEALMKSVSAETIDTFDRLFPEIVRQLNSDSDSDVSDNEIRRRRRKKVNVLQNIVVRKGNLESKLTFMDDRASDSGISSEDRSIKSFSSKSSLLNSSLDNGSPCGSKVGLSDSCKKGRVAIDEGKSISLTPDEGNTFIDTLIDTYDFSLFDNSYL